MSLANGQPSSSPVSASSSSLSHAEKPLCQNVSLNSSGQCIVQPLIIEAAKPVHCLCVPTVRCLLVITTGILTLSAVGLAALPKFKLLRRPDPDVVLQNEAYKWIGCRGHAHNAVCERSHVA